MAGTHWSVRHLAGPPSPAKLRHSPTTPAATNRRPTAPSLHHPRITTIHCSSLNPQNNSSATTTTPKFLRFVVAGVTEILRIFSPADDRVREKDDEILVSGVDDVIKILRSDYENAYFVTGVFTYSMYDSDCLFEDPTIKFRGTDLYYRNLKLLVPFFDGASIALKEIEKGFNSGKNFVLAKWRLRTYLMLPWRPLIVIDGSTRYDLSDEFKIVRHTESWSVSVIEAIGQIFTPGSRSTDG
ncbi:hypothetical protein Drorol1_Dr00024795 [Drosera rotundifolia]